jgi:DNA-binding NtrC family response regulator
MINQPEACDFKSTGQKFQIATQAERALSVLVVEDHALIALDLECILAGAGASHVAIAHSVAQAQRLIERTHFDAAFLDVRLGETPSLPVARTLRAIGVPFAFATGDGSANSLPLEYRTYPLITKPFQERDVCTILQTLLGSRVER